MSWPPAAVSSCASAKVNLPLGATLRQAVSKHPIPNDPPESLEVVDITGKSLAFVNPPHAYDADGVPVPIEMRAEGASIVLDIPHRSGDWRYPLLADPTVSSYVDSNNSTPDCTPNTTICVWPGWWWHEDQAGGPSTFGGQYACVTDPSAGEHAILLQCLVHRGKACRASVMS
ncbi:MAG: hypothetical protein QOJ29_1854 [Thermoleophilaceae bacterium]|nr:hypothetical protein [Thermoleophilaceae bacterium]